MTSPDDAPRSVPTGQLLRSLVLQDITLRHIQAECLVKALPADAHVNHTLTGPTIVVESSGEIAFEHVLNLAVLTSDNTQLGALHIVMVCTYQCTDVPGLNAAELQKYTPSSIIHVWPYLRELVSRTTADFGWPRLTLPTYNANL
jgi:hypothetical protein